MKNDYYVNLIDVYVDNYISVLSKEVPYIATPPPFQFLKPPT